MSERREGHNATRRQTMKRWKVALVAVLTIAMVMQSSNVQAIAEGIAEGLAGDRPVVTDTMPTDGTGTDAATGTEDVTTDEATEDTTSTEATAPETDETATDTEASEEESTDAPAAPEEVVEDTTETEAPAEAPAEEADTTVTLNVEISGAKLTYKAEDGTEQNVTPETDPKSVDVPNTLDFKFTVTPDEGQQVSSVSYGEAVLTTDETGTYTVAAADLAGGEKIVVTTEAVPAEETPAEEAPAEPETPAEGEVATEPTEDEATPEEPTTDGTAEDATPAEPEVLDSEEVVADVSSPAYEGYAYVGDIVVKVTAAEGVLPEGTTVSAYQVNRQDVIEAVSSVVEQNGKVVENSVAIDVTLLGPDGNVIQPDGAVNVCFFNSSVGDSTVNVYRVADDASTVQAIGTRQADAFVQSFDVDHFSIYVVTEEGEPALATYNFHVDNEIVSTQVVKTGDTLYEPAAPKANDNGFKFTGWYTEEQGGDLFDGFGEQDVDETKTVNLYAHFEEVHYVFFYDNRGRIFHTEEGITQEEVSTESASAILSQSLELGLGLTGWYDNESLSGDPVETIILDESNVYLWPRVTEGHWITFNSDGGSYIEPRFVAAGEVSVAPEDPVKAGYEFAGWIAPNGESFEFGNELESDISLTAKWDAGQADYTVIYWIENANDDNYSFLTSLEMTGTSGQQTNARELTYSQWNAIPSSQRDTLGLEWGDIHRSDDHNIENQTIAGDGSTIVNVYYDRDEASIRFYKRESGWLGWVDWSEIESYRITAKVGESIGDRWPKNSGYLWAVDEGMSEYQAYADVMPSGGHKYYGTTKEGEESAEYYVEALDGEKADVYYKGKGYVWDHTDTTPGSGYTISNADSYAMQGFTFYEYDAKWVGGWNGGGYQYNGADFYYSRNSYQLVFVDRGSAGDSKTIQYEAPLADYANYQPSAAGPEGYEFAGWYDNQYGEGEPFDFGSRMPAHAVTLYAKWTPTKNTVSVYPEQGGEGVPDRYEVNFGEKLTEETLRVPEDIDGKKFIGWATRSGEEGNYVYTLFNFDAEIRFDIELYPYYISTGEFGVTYEANGGSGTEPIDEHEYAEDAYADVLHPEGLTAPDGKVFIGWNTAFDGSGVMYQPEDKVRIDGNITLWAIWGDVADTVTITYKSNYPSDVGLVEETLSTNPMPNNSEHTVLHLQDVHFETPDGYRFVGWNTSADGNGKVDVQPGAQVRADEIGDNILYAQWEKLPSIEGYVTLDPADVSEVYDGQAHAAGTAKATDKNGKTAKVEYSVDGEKWTENPAEITATNVSDSVTVKVRASVPGTYTGYVEGTQELEITARPVELTGSGWATDQPYTGKAYGKTDFETEAFDAEADRGLVEGQKLSGVSYEISGTEVGPYEGKFSGTPVVKAEGSDDDLAANYSFSYEVGKLNIVESAIAQYVTLDPADVSEVYDGQAHAAGTAKATDKNGKTAKVEYSVDGEKWTENPAEITATNVSDSVTVKVRASVPGTYTGYVEGTQELEITARPLTVSTSSGSKVYDGTALTAGGSVDGLVEGETVDFRTTGSQTEVGQSQNTYTLEFTGAALETNYTIASEDLGTLTVFPQSIDPSDPDPDNPEPGDPDPNDPDPENPDQPFYTGVSVDSPSDVVYDGADHTWTPTVTDGDGNALVANRDYTVSYSTTDRTNVTGTITVTITGTGNFAGTVTRTYQVVPRPLVVQANDQTKVQGAADPALSSGYNPAQLVAGEEPGWTGGLTREAGEAVGTYAITQGTLALEDNGDFLAANYVLTVLPGTLTITAAPAPDNPPATTDDGGDDTPTTPAGPTNPVPDDTLPVTDDATTDDATPEETVTDDENPLASGDEEGIEDNGNPLASGRGDEDCWVHWLILVGMILTAVYFVGVAVRRRKFTADLLDYEDKVLGNNRNDA